MSTVAVSSRLKDHPRGLLILFFAELWERFSYYGMRALLILFMTKDLLFNDEKAYGIYAAYTALIYTTPIIGGILADRILGNRRSIIIGGIIIALGHFTMFFHGLTPFYLGLAFIICGTGFFKANISTLVGELYEKGDPRRDAGFTLFYVGVNIGAFLAPLVCGTVGELYGWHYGFGLAGIGMLVGLITFLKGIGSLGNKGLPPAGSLLFSKIFMGITVEQLVYLLGFVSVPIFAILVAQYHFFDAFLPILGIGVIVYILVLAFRSERAERNALLVILALMFFHTAFWSFFEQAGSSLNLFTDRNIDRTVFGYTIPTTYFQSLDPAFIILLGPLLSSLWVRLGNLNLDPYPPIKFVIALVLCGCAFGFLTLGIQMANDTGLTSILWIVIAYFIMVVGELCISPIGLSMVTKLAPTKIVSMMMGVWFLSMAFANYLAGAFAKLSAVVTEGGVVVDVKGALAAYDYTFTTIMYSSWAMAAVLLVLTPLLKPVFTNMAKENA